MMWKARSSFDGKFFGKYYSSIYDCQRYIDRYLKKQEEKYLNSFIDTKVKRDKYKSDESYDFARFLAKAFTFGHFIRCYEVTQKRYCDGFDF